MRVLLVEDEPLISEFIAKGLREAGHAVDHAADGKQGLFLASTEPFDVIVLDIEMPIMDGITAARSIRNMGGHSAATPLMALSAFLADSVRNGEWQDTFDIALPKPANRNELHEAVKAALERCRQRGARGVERKRYSLLLGCVGQLRIKVVRHSGWQAAAGDDPPGGLRTRLCGWQQGL